MTFWGFVVGTIGAILAWLTTEFVGRPFRRFFDLRGEVCRRMVQFDNVFARARMADSTRREPIELSSDQDARLTEAENTFRDLASQMRAFTLAEPFAVWIVKRVGYDAFEASSVLIGYSNVISTAGDARELYKRQIEKLLRFHIS